MTPRPQYARHRSDENQAKIVEALRSVGATVFIVGEPLDLLVGFRSANYLIEVKRPGEKLRESQSDFIATWNGQAATAHTEREALEAIGAIRSEWKNIDGSTRTFKTKKSA